MLAHPVITLWITSFCKPRYYTLGGPEWYVHYINHRGTMLPLNSARKCLKRAINQSLALWYYCR